VSGVQAGSGARDHGQCLRQRDALVATGRGLQDAAHVLAVDVLHREEVAAVPLPDVVDLGDVRVLQRRRQPRLVEEHADEVAVLRELRQDALEDHDLLEALDAARTRQVQLGHPATRESAQELVAPQCRSRGQLTGPDFPGGLHHVTTVRCARASVNAIV
jgi:hypothetical protein